MVAASWAAAVVASLGYGVGSVLQSVGAKRTAHIGHVTGVALILVQLPYLLGLVADGLAFAANVVALQRLPLFLVQSILTASVGISALIAAIRGMRLGPRDWASLGILGTGLVLLSLSASSESALGVSETTQWVILASALVPASLGVLGMRLKDRPSTVVLSLSAGLAFTGVAVAARGLSASEFGWALGGSPLLWGIAVHGLLGTVYYAVALQRGAVTVVTSVTFMTELVVPSIIGLLIFGDTVHPGHGLSAGLGFALAIGGTVAVVRFAE